MTITIRKLHLAVAIVAVAMLVPATAVATHIFTDVPDDQFYTDAVEWAFDNGITTGTSATTFEPDAGVTRGQNVTFAKRYDDNIVQPALTDLESDIAAHGGDIAALASRVTALEAAQPFAVTASESGSTEDLTTTAAGYVSVSITAPADGHVTLNSTAAVSHAADGGFVGCTIAESTAIPVNIFTSESIQRYERPEFSTGLGIGSLAGTRTFGVTAGATKTYVLACQEFTDGGTITTGNLTAIFTPAP